MPIYTGNLSTREVENLTASHLYINGDMSMLSTPKRISKTTDKIHVIFQNQTSVYSTFIIFKNPITISLIVGILLLFCLLCVLLLKQYRRRRRGTYLRKSGLHQKCIYYPNTGEKFRNNIEDEKQSDEVVVSEMEAHASPYEAIDFRSDDLNVIMQSESPNCIIVHQNSNFFSQPETYIKDDVDTNEYLCPTSSTKSLKCYTENAKDDSYLTVQ